jgi:hypothetical protein
MASLEQQVFARNSSAGWNQPALVPDSLASRALWQTHMPQAANPLKQNGKSMLYRNKFNEPHGVQNVQVVQTVHVDDGRPKTGDRAVSAASACSNRS